MADYSCSPDTPPAKRCATQSGPIGNAPHFRASAFLGIFPRMSGLPCEAGFSIKNRREKPNFHAALIYGKGINDRSKQLQIKEMTFSDLR
jgi:hypothetical protein